MLFGKLKSQTYVIKANAAYQKGNSQEALEWLEKAYNTGKAATDIVTTYGYLLLKTGNLEQALKIFNEELSSPKITETEKNSIKSNYALALWKQGQLDSAIGMFEEILPHYKNTNVYGSLGYLYILRGDLKKALDFNLEAYEYNDANGVILDNLGQVYYMMGDLEKAVEIFEKLMNLNPKFPEAFYDYALVLEKLDRKEKSIEKLKTALLYKPNYLSGITTEEIENKLELMEKSI